MIQYLCPLLPAPWIKWGEGQGVPLGLVFKASEAENPARPCHQWPGLGLHWQALGATRQTQLTLISPHPSAWRRLPRPHAQHVGVLLISKNWKLNLLVQPWDPT